MSHSLTIARSDIAPRKKLYLLARIGRATFWKMFIMVWIMYKLWLVIILTRFPPEIFFVNLLMLHIMIFVCVGIIQCLRCHDFNLSTWDFLGIYLVGLIIPYVTMLSLLFLMFAKGRGEANRYGQAHNPDEFFYVMAIPSVMSLPAILTISWQIFLG